MPEPEAHPDADAIRKVARIALGAGLVILAAKWAIFYSTNSAAVLSDAVESIVNIAAAGFMMYVLMYANRPADKDHPYGHGKIEFIAVGVEGALICAAAIGIAVEACRRFFAHEEIVRLTLGTWLMGAVALVCLVLACYVFWSGRKHDSPAIKAHAKHLFTDAGSTIGVIAGLILVQYSGKLWLDPVVALVMAAIIAYTSWRLFGQSVGGLLDRIDPADDQMIRQILDEEIAAGAIDGYHKVRHRHAGTFHWVDLHIQVSGDMNVRESHELASRIERRIEAAVGQGNATAHVEPSEEPTPPTPEPDDANPDEGESPTEAEQPDAR